MSDIGASLAEKDRGQSAWAKVLLSALFFLTGQMAPGLAQSNETCEPITQEDVASGRLASLANPKEVSRRVEALLKVEGDADYGAWLAGECNTCHASGIDTEGMAAIDGSNAREFFKAMVEYRLGMRSNAVMQTQSRVLGTEELTALAAHYSRQ